jgi:hypothetical protein
MNVAKVRQTSPFSPMIRSGVMNATIITMLVTPIGGWLALVHPPSLKSSCPGMRAPGLSFFIRLDKHSAMARKTGSTRRQTPKSR